MKKLNFLLPLFLFISCSSTMNYIFVEKKNENSSTNINTYQDGRNLTLSYNSDEIKKIISSAKFEISNKQIYKNPDKWKGETISVSGTIVVKTEISLDDNFFQLQGRIGDVPSGDFINYIIELDHPLPKQTRIDENVKTITPGKKYRVFGVFRELKQFLNEYGTPTMLPLLQCKLIYDGDDFEFRNPLWVTRSLEVLPNGEINIENPQYRIEKDSSTNK